MMEISKIESSLLRETIYHTTVGAGLRVFVMPRKGYSKKHASFAAHHGSLDTHFIHPSSEREVEVPEGIAHFLEHEMFEREDGSVFDEFSRLGASANAFTDYTSTTYVFSTTDNFEESLATLLSLVQEPHFTDKNVEKEKGIIEQELRMYQDMPPVKAETNLLKGLYHRNPVRVDIGGTPESIREITPQMLYTCHEAFYHPANMALFVTGDVDVCRVVELVSSTQEKWDRGPSSSPRRIYPDEPEAVHQRTTEEKMSVSLPIVLTGWKDRCTGQSGRKLLARQAAGGMLLGALFGRSSAAFERLYEQRLIGDRFAASFEAEPVYSHASVGGESPEPSRLIDEITETMEDARSRGVDRKTVQRLKNKVVGEFVALFSSPEQVARLFNAVLFKGASIFDYYEVLRHLAPEDLERLLDEVFVPEHCAVSVVSPRER